MSHHQHQISYKERNTYQRKHFLQILATGYFYQLLQNITLVSLISVWYILLSANDQPNECQKQE